ncbi:MAG: M50 family metallopeptidase [Pirellulales bacterium]
MRDFLSWNFYLGPVRGVQVRLHVFFLLLAVMILAGPNEIPLAYRAACVAVLLVSVLWHELGHCFASRKLGYGPERIILWPFGGLEPCPCAHDPQHEWATAAAGMLANFLVCVVSFAVLLAARQLDELSLNPLLPPPPEATFTWPLLLGLVFWFNWMLVLVNLLPAFPLDGAQVLRAMLWPHFGYRTAMLQTAWFAKITAFVLAVVALVLYDKGPVAFATVPLLVLATFLYFAARQESDRLQDQETDDSLFGYDFSQGYTSLERAVEPKRRRSRLAPLWNWLEERRENRLRRQQELEDQEDARMDDVLAQLHRYGIDGLSPEDRALLNRVSARYRSRLRS